MAVEQDRVIVDEHVHVLVLGSSPASHFPWPSTRTSTCTIKTTFRFAEVAV